MNIKRFQSVSRILSSIMIAVGGIPVVSMAIFGLALFLLRDYSGGIEFKPGEYTIFTAYRMQGSTPIPQSQEQIAVWGIATCASIIYFYSSIRGSMLFRKLSLGETPFTIQFVKSLKTISFLLIACDIGIHIVYSLVMTLLLTLNGGGYHIEVGIGNTLIVGLVIYCLAGVINYGIELQKLSDDVV